jgi:tetratricopeptide (TPR) repeat protein
MEVAGWIMRYKVIRRILKSLVLLLLAGYLVPAPSSVFAQGSSKSQELATDLQRAQEAIQTHNQAEAEEQFHAALKLDPSNVEAHANLGVMAFFRGDCPAAEKEFRSALKTAPSLTKVQALLAVCEKKLGEPSAQVDLASAFEKLQDPKLRTQVGVELADLYYQKGDLGQTASVLYILSAINPDNVDILFFEQRVYSELASSALDKLAVLAPDSARMQQLIAERLINEGDLKDATIHYRKALKIDPKLAGTHFELAESLMEGSPNDLAAQKEASSELDAATSVDGDSSKIECELGRIAKLQSKFDSAFAHYQRAYQLDPGNSDAEMGLADLLRMQNKLEEAAKYLQMAVAADPLNAQAHYKLSQIDKQLNLTEEEKKQMQLFMDIRASKNKIQLLYQQMKPQASQAGDKVPSDSTP